MTLTPRAARSHTVIAKPHAFARPDGVSEGQWRCTVEQAAMARFRQESSSFDELLKGGDLERVW
eukprot:13284616-Alexandrium_andersonii.AAC.1